MKETRVTALSLALLLASASTFALAAEPRAFDVAFDKCFDRKGDPPYVATFAGTTTGEVSGPLEARILVSARAIEPGQDHIQADYVLSGTLPFTARVGGRVEVETKRAVLRGYVSVGPAWLVGAGVRDEFVNYTGPTGLACSRGILHVLPRWKQTQGDSD